MGKGTMMLMLLQTISLLAGDTMNKHKTRQPGHNANGDSCDDGDLGPFVG